MVTWRNILRPKNSATEKVKAAQLWVVEWTSRHGRYYTDTKQEFEAFSSKDVADSYAEDLRRAYKLIRHTSGTQVVVRKSKDLV